MADHRRPSGSTPSSPLVSTGLWALILAMVLAGPLAGQSTDDPVALVLRSHSVESLLEPSQGSDALGEDGPPQVGSFLFPDDTLQVPDHHRVVLLRRDGQVDRFDAGHEATFTPGPPEAAPLFRLLRALLLPSSTDLVPGEEGPLSPDADARGPDPLRPIGNRMIRSLTPLLVWEGASEIEGYQLHLWPPEGGVVSLDAGVDSSWTLPSEAALTPGGHYEWAVETIPQGQVGPRARFRVASREILDEVADQLGRLREMGLDPEDDGILAAAGIFRTMGLPYDALDTLRLLQEAPDPWGPELQGFYQRLTEDLTHTDEIDDQNFFPL